MNEASLDQKIMVVAKAFFDDGKYDKDYPFTDVSEQYDEIKLEHKKGNISLDFINFVYEANTK